MVSLLSTQPNGKVVTWYPVGKTNVLDEYMRVASSIPTRETVRNLGKYPILSMSFRGDQYKTSVPPICK